MGEDEAVLDKRPITPRRGKKKTRKKRPKVSAAKKAGPVGSDKTPEPKETVLVGNPQIEHIEEDDVSEPGAVTFFSKYKHDEILYKQSEIVQLGTNKWVTLPAKVARFNDHKFTTVDKEIIDYIRNPMGVAEGFDRYEVEVFEIGKPEHKPHIHRLSDDGIREYLMKLHSGARQVLQAEGYPLE